MKSVKYILSNITDFISSRRYVTILSQDLPIINKTQKLDVDELYSKPRSGIEGGAEH
jgi:hypothetical protein